MIFSFISIVSLWSLNIEWKRLFYRLFDIFPIFLQIGHISLEKFDNTLISFLESVTVTILATFYSLLMGLVFGGLMSRNLIKNKYIPAILSAYFTFVRAIPTPIWVLMALVCLGFGPAPGIVGLSMHSTAFFARAFRQSFEEVSEEVIEALKATGANRLQVFFSAIIPSSSTQLFAWGFMRFEINFSESAILGMVGAGGIGYIVMATMNSYKLGRAGAAIFMIFLFAISIELLFTTIKHRMKV